jgi:hypothetical protein
LLPIEPTTGVNSRGNSYSGEALRIPEVKEQFERVTNERFESVNM